MNFNINKYGTFFIFLSLSFTLWFVYKYQEVYTKKVKVLVNFTNVPSNVSYDNENKLMPINMRLTASGFKLLKATYFHPVVSLDYTKVVDNIDDEILFDLNKHESIITNQLSDEYRVVDMIDDVIQLPVTLLQQKRIPIKFEPEIIYKNNLVPVKLGFEENDSIVVSGNAKTLEGIDFIEFRPRQIIITDTIRKIRLDLASTVPNGINVESDDVVYTIITAQMTEGTIDLKVNVTDIPDAVAVKSIPSIVQVTYTVPLKYYDVIDSDDFVCNIPFEQLEEAENIIMTNVFSKSDLVQDFRTIPNQIKVLVIK